MPYTAHERQQQQTSRHHEVCQQKAQDRTAEAGEKVKRNRRVLERAFNQTQRRYRKTSTLPEETKENTEHLDRKLQDLHQVKRDP